MRLLSLLLLALPLSALGQDVPYLVRDLPGLTIHDSMQYGQTCFWANTGNITWFTAMTASGGREIFKTDGTAAGTVQVTHGTGVPESKYNGPFLGIANGKLIYGGVDAGGEGIYALDTNGGDPVLLGRFVLSYLTNGVVQHDPAEGDALYFTARSDTYTKHDLWRTYGTPLTTARVELLAGDQGPFNGIHDTRLFSAGPWMYFVATTAQGTGLHRTDGTSDNTRLLLPLTTFSYAYSSARVAALENRLILSVATSATQSQLWATDGTTGGTVQIVASLWSAFSPIGVLGGKLIFDNLGTWTTDGTPAGTHPSDVAQNFTALSGLGFPGPGRVIGDRLFFIRNGWLYVTDGTAAGTHSNFLASPGSSGEGFAIGNFYYFGHDDGVHGMELWRTDGTTTELAADINPGSRNGIDDSTGFVRPDGTVLFAATTYDSGREPWITDGTAAGTHILQNIAADDPLNGSSPSELRASGSTLFFKANLTGGPAIGTSDGTSAGTSATLVDPRWSIENAVAANGHYFFDNYVDGFYASDGTAAGTTKISVHYQFAQPVANGVVYGDGADLWFSDGTVAGTRTLHSFDSSTGTLLTIISTGSVAWVRHGTEIWKTDGSDAGTVPFPMNPAPTDGINDVIESGSSVYFIEPSTLTHGIRLWRSDKNGSGARIVKDLGAFSYARFLGATARVVYVSLAGYPNLYRSDGTDSGTIALPVTGPCPTAAFLGETLFLMSYTTGPRDGPAFLAFVTLWRSDGTVAGTTALQVMQPPMTYSNLCGPVVALGNSVYYAGYDPNHGWQLWQSDGTSAGTHLTADPYPGPQDSSPKELTLAGNRIFFSADSPNIGRELWAIGAARHRAVRP